MNTKPNYDSVDAKEWYGAGNPPQTPNPFTGEGYARKIDPKTPEGQKWLAGYLSTMTGFSTPQQVTKALENPLGQIALKACEPEMQQQILAYADMAGRKP